MRSCDHSSKNPSSAARNNQVHARPIQAIRSSRCGVEDVIAMTASVGDRRGASGPSYALPGRARSCELVRIDILPYVGLIDVGLVHHDEAGAALGGDLLAA